VFLFLFLGLWRDEHYVSEPSNGYPDVVLQT